MTSAFKGLAVFAAAAGLTACASGGASFISGHDGGGSSGSDQAIADQAVTFDQAAPDLVAASGNALLPGGRSPAADALLGQAGPNPATASLSAGSPLATGLVSASAQLTGPLLSLNGQRSALLGVSANTAILGLPAAANVSLNVGGGASVQGATTQLIVSANTAVGALKPIVTPPIVGGGTGVTAPPVLGGGTGVTPPLTAPVLQVANNAVPGTVPLPTIIKQLKAGLLGH